MSFLDDLDDEPPRNLAALLDAMNRVYGAVSPYHPDELSERLHTLKETELLFRARKFLPEHSRARQTAEKAIRRIRELAEEVRAELAVVVDEEYARCLRRREIAENAAPVGGRGRAGYAGPRRGRGGQSRAGSPGPDGAKRQLSL